MLQDPSKVEVQKMWQLDETRIDAAKTIITAINEKPIQIKPLKQIETKILADEAGKYLHIET